MASKLKIIPLGGLGEIGKNLTIYEYGKDMFLVDCGMGFPDQDLYGVDLVIPDISYLKANKTVSAAWSSRMGMKTISVRSLTCSSSWTCRSMRPR